MPKNRKSKIEQYVIDKIKEIRTEKNISQTQLALALETSRGFIGQVESPQSASKYNINHLNTIANELEVSIKEFFPDQPFPETKKKEKAKKKPGKQS
jgi:transcriptional regulator with XRE-family HTH domain